MSKQYSGTFQFTDTAGAPVGTPLTGGDAAQVNQAYRAYLQGQGPRGIAIVNGTNGKVTYYNFEAQCICGGVWTPTTTTVADPDCEQPAC